MGLVFGVLVFTFGSKASAEDGLAKVSVEKEGYSYDFEDDPLAATGDVPAGLRISVRPAGKRTLLIRARAQFITELLLSAESL